MSDLSATNCGCGSSSVSSCNSGCFGNNSCLWIILLLFFCGGNNNGCGCNGIMGGENNCCEWIIWILLLSCFCGGNSGCC